MNIRLHFALTLLLVASPVRIMKAGSLFDTCPIPGEGFVQKMKKAICIAGVAWLTTEVGLRRFHKITKAASPLKEDPFGFVRSIVRQAVKELGIVTHKEFLAKVESVLNEKYPELNQGTTTELRKIANQQKKLMTEAQVCGCIEKVMQEQGVSEESVKEIVKQEMADTVSESQMRGWLEEALLQTNSEVAQEDMKIIAHEVALEVVNEALAEIPKHSCEHGVSEEDVKRWITETTSKMPTQAQMHQVIEDAVSQRSSGSNEEQIRSIAHGVTMEVLKEMAAKHPDCAFGKTE